MAEDSGQERTEDATQRRRQQARKKGTVARSPDLTGALVMVLLVALMPAIVAGLGSSFSLGLRTGFSTIPNSVSFNTVTRFVWSILTPSIIALTPLIGVAMLVGVVSNLGQVGFVLSPEVLNPNLNKLNPLNGLKRLLSRDSVFEAIKASAKTALFAWIAWKVISDNWNTVLNLSWGSPYGSLSKIALLTHSVFMRVAIVWLILAAIDYYYQRLRVSKQLKMTKHEVKQEFKEMEQSAELKGAIAQRRRRLAKMRTAEAIRNADVIITNPTHYSIVLKYDKEKMHAPMVVAKGADLLALRIRELAKESRIPIVPHPPLARQLYKKCEVGDYVPRELFQAVAEVLAFVYRSIHKIKSA